MSRLPRFAHPATEELYKYWDRKRGARPAPDRSEIEPGDIRAILPDTFILEVEEGRGFTWRLAGTRICALHCRELKGQDFLKDWQGKERATMLSLLDAVVRESAVGVVQFDGTTERDQRLAMEMVLLPLRVFGRPICRVLGAIGPADVPYWFGLFPPEKRTVTGMRLVWPSGDPRSFQGEPPALAPANTPPPSVLAGLDRVRRYRHLMVLDGGKN